MWSLPKDVSTGLKIHQLSNSIWKEIYFMSFYEFRERSKSGYNITLVYSNSSCWSLTWNSGQERGIMWPKWNINSGWRNMNELLTLTTPNHFLWSGTILHVQNLVFQMQNCNINKCDRFGCFLLFKFMAFTSTPAATLHSSQRPFTDTSLNRITHLQAKFEGKQKRVINEIMKFKGSIKKAIWKLFNSIYFPKFMSI